MAAASLSDDLRWDVFADCDGELKRLNLALADAMKANGRVVLVIGGEDSGKSTLLKEFADRAYRAHRKVLTASVECKPKEEPAPSWPLDDLIDRLEKQYLWGRLVRLARTPPKIGGGMLGGAVGASAGLVTNWFPGAAGFLIQKLPGLVEGIFGVIGFLVGWRLTPHTKGALARKPVDTLQRIAKRRTLLLVLDDLDRADARFYPQFLELCRAIEDKQARFRALIVATSRPFDQNPLLWRAWNQVAAESYGQDRDINLDDLRKDDRWKREFLDAYLKVVFKANANDLDRSFRDKLIKWTQGSPHFILFIKEALRFCVTQGWIRRQDDRWVQVGLIGRIDPPRLRSIIAGRWHELFKEDEEEKRILQFAAVEGFKAGRFTLEVLTKILGQAPQEIAEKLNGKLGRQGGWVVQEERARQTAPFHFYRFQHSLYREVIYGELEKDTGFNLHDLHANVGSAKKAIWVLRGLNWESIAEELAGQVPYSV